jgi:Nif-specific regulatory protein
MNQRSKPRRTGSGCSRDELEALHAISHIVAGRSAPADMFARILGVLEEKLQLLRGTIMLLLPDNADLVVEATRGGHGAVHAEARYGRGEGIIGRTVETGRPSIVPCIAEEPAFQSRIHTRSRRERHTASFVCIPVLIDDEVVGTISGDFSCTRRERLEQDTHVVAIVASMIATHLKTERLMRLEREALEAENERLRSDAGESFRPESIIGGSNAMRNVLAKVRLVSRNDTTVILRGASGTGKELIASAIHYAGPRASFPLVTVNCAALNDNVLESELFGHERGAFTGAVTARIGRMEMAEGGTLFLDEIGEFSPATQAKLLRVLQDKYYERLGGNERRKADIRLITATNRDLEEAVRRGTFREDLYYRIHVFPIYLPPLNERKEDILPLANHFIRTLNERLGKCVRRISTEAIEMLMSYHWPGNVRELENCIEYAALTCSDGVLYGHNLPPTLQVPLASDISARQSLMARVRVLERDMIIDALKRTRGNMSAAARQLGITIRMIRYKIANLQIDTTRFTGLNHES